MATCTVTLNIGYGADAPVARGVVKISRIERGDNGDMVVTVGQQEIPMVSPPPVVTLEQGVVYRFVESWAGGITRYCTIPATATADYSDLVDTVPVPDGPGILGDSIINDVFSDAGSDTRTTTDALYELQADLDGDVAGLLGSATASRSAFDGRYLQSSGQQAVLNGSGSPEGVVTATVGTLYVDTAKTNGAFVWRKDSGSGNTGWKVLSGDTGWRDITGLLSPGWSATRFLLRRRNSQVDVQIYDLIVPGGGTALTIPTGFRPTFALQAWLESDAGTPVRRRYSVAAGPVTFATVGGDPALRGICYWPTDQSWPTTLPGTAA